MHQVLLHFVDNGWPSVCSRPRDDKLSSTGEKECGIRPPTAQHFVQSRSKSNLLIREHHPLLRIIWKTRHVTESSQGLYEEHPDFQPEDILFEGVRSTTEMQCQSDGEAHDCVPRIVQTCALSRVHGSHQRKGLVSLPRADDDASKDVYQRTPPPPT
jgi:hypothetical protein